MIIGIVGKAGSGKTESAKVFEAQGFVRRSFAEPVYSGVANALGIKKPTTQEEKAEFKSNWFNLDLLNDTTNWNPENITQASGRRFLQFFGTNFGRACHLDIWVALEAWRLEQEGIWERIWDGEIQGIVYDDVRFQNEAEWITNHAAHRLIHIERQGGCADTHESEQLNISTKLYTNRIYNEGTLTALQNTIYRITQGAINES